MKMFENESFTLLELKFMQKNGLRSWLSEREARVSATPFF